MSKIPFVSTNEGLSVFLNDGDKHFPIRKDHPNYGKALALLKAQDNREVTEKEIEELLHLPTYVSTWTEGEVYVKDGRIYVRDFGFSEAVSNKVLLMMAQDVSPEPLMLLLQHVRTNPDKKIWDRLAAFLIANGFLIDEDGYIIGYRRVTGDFKDFHSGRFDNSPGQFVRMDREEVANDPNRACAPGLHIGSLKYARDNYHAGRGTLIACRVHPKDVVSVPFDYRGAKMRVCAFYVIGELVDIQKGLPEEAAVLTIAHFEEAVHKPVMDGIGVTGVPADVEDVAEGENEEVPLFKRDPQTISEDEINEQICKLYQENEDMGRTRIVQWIKDNWGVDITEYRVRKALGKV